MDIGNNQTSIHFSYRGLFKNGLFEGQGVYQYPDGAYYEGCFKNN